MFLVYLSSLPVTWSMQPYLALPSGHYLPHLARAGAQVINKGQSTAAERPTWLADSRGATIGFPRQESAAVMCLD